MLLLKLMPSFDPYGWIHILVHGLGFDLDFKGWMEEAWKREHAKWFLGPLGRVLGQLFFFQIMSLVARISMVGLDHPFNKRVGIIGRKAVFGHNLGLGAWNRLASTPIVLKWRELSRGRKWGRSARVDFDG